MTAALLLTLVVAIGCGWAWRWGPPSATWRLRDVLAAFAFFVGASGVAGSAWMALLTGEWIPDSANLLPGVLGTAIGSVLAATMVLRRAQARPLGLEPPPGWAWGAVAAGLPLFLACSASWAWLLELLGWSFEPQQLLQSLAETDPFERALLVGYGIVGAPVVEELIFRGFLLPPLAHHVGRRSSVLIAGCAFGLMHLTDPAAVVPLILLGVGLSWLRFRSASIWPGLVIHLLNNTVALTLSLANAPLPG